MKRNRGILFLAGVLLAGLLTLLPYGAYLDQVSEQRILYSNIKEYLLHLPGNIPGLVQEFTDYGVLEISVDEDRDHGMAIYYPAFPVWYINQASPCAGSLFWHAYTFLLVFWGMCSLFLLGRELFQEEALSAFIVLLFFLTPRMFAESHYNNKDVVLLSLTFTLFYWGRRMMRDTSIKNICVFAFAGALAANMKIVGIWIFGMLGLYILFYYIVSKRFDRKILAKTIGCILLWAALFILMTPACWPDMKSFFEYFFFKAVDYDLWHDYVLFDGRMLHRDYTGMPRKYLPILMLFTIPVGILILCAWGCMTAAVDFVKRKGRCLEDTGYVLLMIAVGGGSSGICHFDGYAALQWLAAFLFRICLCDRRGRIWRIPAVSDCSGAWKNSFPESRSVALSGFAGSGNTDELSSGAQFLQFTGRTECAGAF